MQVGGVIGTIQSNTNSIFSTIESCRNSAKVTVNGYTDSCYTYEGIIEEKFNTNRVGGIVGYAEKVKITNTNNTGIVENSSIADSLVGIGGIVGELRNGDIVNSFNAGEIKGNYGIEVGGILGGGYYNININNCYNMNNITGKYNVGGIVGGVAQANIKYCYNNSTISANETAAGIVGLQVPFNSNDYTNNSIWYCYNIGNIIGNVRTGSIAGAIRYYSCDYVYGLYGTASDTASEVQNYKGDGSHFGMLNKSDLISMVLTNYDSKFKEDTLNKNKGYPILTWQN